MRIPPSKQFFSLNVRRDFTFNPHRCAVSPKQCSTPQGERSVGQQLAISFLALEVRFNQLWEYKAAARVVALFPGLMYRHATGHLGSGSLEAYSKTKRAIANQLDAISIATNRWLLGEGDAMAFGEMIEDCERIESTDPIQNPHYQSLMRDETGQRCLFEISKGNLLAGIMAEEIEGKNLGDAADQICDAVDSLPALLTDMIFAWESNDEEVLRPAPKLLPILKTNFANLFQSLLRM